VINKIVSYGVVLLIVIATLGFILETVPEWRRRMVGGGAKPFCETLTAVLLLRETRVCGCGCGCGCDAWG
jgi:hypothetical protein